MELRELSVIVKGLELNYYDDQINTVMLPLLFV